MPQRTYVIGIAGTATGALAGLLQAAGHEVTGSDAHIYPPMSEKLAEWGVPVLEGYAAEHLQPAPDLVIVGNVVRANNPEAVAARSNNLPTMSMPAALAHFAIGSRHSVVVAGTHGKTTTTALLAHVLVSAGCDPGFLVGGALVGYRDTFRLGTGDTFVVEGDEYDTAYFDKGPKFLHYRGKTVVITSLEFDHADIFADVEAVEAAFAKLVQQVPEDGHIVVWAGAWRAIRLVQRHARCQAITVYGSALHKPELAWLRRPHQRLLPQGVTLGPEGIAFTLPANEGCAPAAAAPGCAIQVGLWGGYNVDNALAVVAACRARGLSDAQIAHGMATFRGVRRRMEVRCEVGEVVLVDDFGHHPTAVGVTLAAARTRWPQRRLWALFEPRSATSRGNHFESAYIDALAGADEVVVAFHSRLREVAPEDRFSPERVAEGLRRRQVGAAAPPTTAAIVSHVVANARAGDVFVVLSNGDFDGLIGKLEGALRAWAEPAR